jgi:hypothetical protein
MVTHRMNGVVNGESMSSGALGELDGHTNNVLHNSCIGPASNASSLHPCFDGGAAARPRPLAFSQPTHVAQINSGIGP